MTQAHRGRPPHLYTFGELAFFDCGGTRLYLHQTEVAPESVPYFQVADIHAATRELEAKGVTFLGAPHLIHRHEDGSEEWMAFFTDPEGRTLALMARVEAGEASRPCCPRPRITRSSPRWSRADRG